MLPHQSMYSSSSFNLTILHSPIDKTNIEIEDLVSNWWGDKSIFENKVDLEKVNPAPLIKPGSAHFIKLVIWKPKCNLGQTALFVNYQDAYNRLIHLWNKRFKKQSVPLRLCQMIRIANILTMNFTCGQKGSYRLLFLPKA